MAQPLIGDGQVDHAGMLVALAASEGSASHPWLHSVDLNAGPSATRNLADLLHLLSALHGEQRGLVEIAATQNVWAGADHWFGRAAHGFALERGYVARLVVAAGPVPPSAGETATLTAVLAQRQALETIAQSDRFGCAIGAVCGLLLDWQAIRATLDTAADRLGTPIAPCRLPDEDACAAMLEALPDHPRLDRALSFGARQIFVQHRGLFELLEARASAREG